jgi:hypothetical protein
MREAYKKRKESNIEYENYSWKRTED